MNSQLQYDYLMHAILGLSASELMLKEPDLAIFAMAHRLKAIKAIKRTLADVQKSNTFEEGNALMATCFALTFQSVLLDDGMAEFMTFCRGIIITAIQMWCKGAKFIFHDFIGEDQMAILKPLMEQLPTINSEWTDMAVASLQALEPLCKQPVEVEYIGLLRDIAQTLYTSSFEGESTHQTYASPISSADPSTRSLSDSVPALRLVDADIAPELCTSYRCRQCDLYAACLALDCSEANNGDRYREGVRSTRASPGEGGKRHGRGYDQVA